MNNVPESHKEARELLQQTSDLPDSLGSFWGEKPWTLPETGGAVTVDITKDSKAKKGKDVGPGFRQFEGGEAGTRTVLQQLPGKNIRLYKLIDQHDAAAGSPTEFSFQFNRGCAGGHWWSNKDERCATEKCVRKHWWTTDGQTCTKEWLLDDSYSYLGHKGIALINPNESSSAIPAGTPVGFLTEPVARDANRRPVPVKWNLADSTMHIKVYDTAGVRYPVVVDPHWFVGRWLVRGALVRGAPSVGTVLVALGCATRITLAWPETVGQPWYRRVWQVAIKCLEGL